jgi:hypothetical protein
MPDAWDEITATLSSSPYPVTVLPPDPSRSERCLATLGVTTRSWLGAVIAHSGGLLVDHGWLRVLGSGSGDLPDALYDTDPAGGGLVVALDVLGGQFVWAPSEPGKPPTLHYFGPDTLDWQDLGNGYGDWLHAMLAGAMTEFYENLRWPGWEAEVAALALDQGITTYPPPSTVEGKDLSAASRKPAPMTEVIAFHRELASFYAGGASEA